MHISRGDLTDGRILWLLRYHFDKCHEVTPPGSAHVFDVSRLAAPEIDFWSAWDGEQLLGVGAMKPLDATHGEVKSMHTAETARRRGVGSAMLVVVVACLTTRWAFRCDGLFQTLLTVQGKKSSFAAHEQLLATVRVPEVVSVAR